MAGVDVLLVSLGSTAGLRAADAELETSLQRAGASVVVAAATHGKEMRTMALVDLGWALAARRAAEAALREHEPRAVIYSSTTSALLWPRPGAIRFDAVSAANRPGRHGVWQRPLERRRLREATLLVPWSEGGLDEAPEPHPEAIVVPVPVEPSAPLDGERDIAAITYAANPEKKGLDRVLAAWAAARREGEELVVAGGVTPIVAEGVRDVGRLEPDEYRALLRRSRVFLTAPRREDYGIAQLEALADGCMVVTTEAPGPYVALGLARELDARLVGEDLAAGLRAALDEPASDYVARAAAALMPWRQDATDRAVAEQLLSALLP